MNDQNKNQQSPLEIISQFPEPQRTESLNAAMELVSLRMTSALEGVLSEQQISELDALNERNASADEVDAYLRQNVPDFERMRDQVIEDTDSELRERLLGSTSATHVTIEPPTEMQGLNPTPETQL